MMGPIKEDEWAAAGVEKVTEVPTRDHWKADSESTICDEATCAKFFSYFTRRHHCRRCGNIFCDAHSRHAVPLDARADFHPAGARSRACGFCWNEFRGWWAEHRWLSSGSGSGSSGGGGGGKGASSWSRNSETSSSPSTTTTTMATADGGTASGGGGKGNCGGSGPMTPTPVDCVAARLKGAMFGSGAAGGGRRGGGGDGASGDGHGDGSRAMDGKEDGIGGLPQSLPQSVPRDWNWSTF